MKAGCELDALVAEKVMGWTYRSFYNGGGEWTDAVGKKVAFGGLDGGSLHHFSVNIADAWLVVEKMRTKGKHFLMMSPADTGACQASFFSGPEDTSEGSGVVDTAPLAICLASLRAMGVENV